LSSSPFRAIDPAQHLRHDVERLHVLDDLRWAASAGDDAADVRVLEAPSKRQLSQGAVGGHPAIGTTDPQDLLLHESGEELRIFVVDSTQARPVGSEGCIENCSSTIVLSTRRRCSGVSAPAQSDALTILSSIVSSMTEFFLRMTYSDFRPVVAAPV
jgi:hypothetical protein